jgi:hypothetical protein
MCADGSFLDKQRAVDRNFAFCLAERQMFGAYHVCTKHTAFGVGFRLPEAASYFTQYARQQ